MAEQKTWNIRILHISDLHERGAREQFRRQRVLGEEWEKNLAELVSDGPIAAPLGFKREDLLSRQKAYRHWVGEGLGLTGFSRFRVGPRSTPPRSCGKAWPSTRASRSSRSPPWRRRGRLLSLPTSLAGRPVQGRAGGQWEGGPRALCSSRD